MGYLAQIAELKKQKREQKHDHLQRYAAIERRHEETIRQLKATIEQSKRATELRDSTDIGAKLREMGISPTPERLTQFLSKQVEVAGVLDPINLSVNNNQFACAVAAVYADSKRQFLSVPSGMGKSRIIAAVIALQSMCRGIDRFTVVFTSELLRRASEGFYKEVAAVLGVELDLQVYGPKSRLDGLVKEGYYAVIDEADLVLLDHAEHLTNPRMLALSATPYSKAAVEREYLEQRLGFTVIDSKMEGSVSVQSASTATTTASADKFFAETRSYAKIIYAPSHSDHEICQRATLTNHEDLARLKQLTVNDVLLITDPTLARGVDYRAAEGTHGIALFVMSACDSDRAYVQLLGRVGRYREPCLRYVWDGLRSEVDSLKQATMLGNLRRRKTARGHLKKQYKMVPGQSRLNVTVTATQPSRAVPTKRNQALLGQP